jgi:Domain of unknown function (DUF2431)
MSSCACLCILVVGDGDFSGSLAILRAYRQHIRELVATSLVSCRAEVEALYPTAREILEELEANDVCTILFGVDATKLHLDSRLRMRGSFDFILFQHPHLGHQDQGVATALPMGDDVDPTKLPKYAILARRHSSLLAHYLHSSRELIRASGDQRLSMVHLCLCAGQSKSWQLERHIRRLGLEYNQRPIFASNPLWPHLEASAPTSIGCNIHDYWLSWYGYQHQATTPSKTSLSENVNSHHHFFRIRQVLDAPLSSARPERHSTRKSATACPICFQEQCVFCNT